MNDISDADDRAGFRRTNEVHLELEGGRKLLRLEGGGQRWAESLVQHGGKKPALDVAQGIGEVPSCLELHTDSATARLGFKVLSHEHSRRRRVLHLAALA